MQHSTAARCFVLLVVCVALARVAECGKVLTLGGAVGWTNEANINYTEFMSSFKLKIGDSLAFPNDATTDHTAVWVDRVGFETCGEKGSEYSIFTIHSDQIYIRTFTQSGPKYCICNIPAHCIQGQKVAFIVYNADGTLNTTASEEAGSSAASPVSGFSWVSQILIVVVATSYLMLAATTMAQ